MLYIFYLKTKVSVIEFAKSQVEWMNDKIVQSFEAGRFNPFDFKHVRLCRSIHEVNSIHTPSRNKLVLASTPDLQYGFSRSLFADWCQNPKNTIIFTTRTSMNTLAFNLIENPSKRSISLEVISSLKPLFRKLVSMYFETD